MVMQHQRNHLNIFLLTVEYMTFFFKYVVKSVPLSVINRTHDVMQKTFFMWILDCQWSSYINNILAFKYILSNVFLNCLTDCKNRSKF